MFVRVTALFVAFMVTSVALADEVVFEGYDPLWQATTVVEKRGDGYFMDGDAMDELRHRNMPNGGLSLAIRARTGAPDNYFLIRDGRMDIYVNCEFGPCRKKRSIAGQ